MKKSYITIILAVSMGVGILENVNAQTKGASGGHFSSATNRYYYVRDRYFLYRYLAPGLAYGLDGIVGLEYKIPEIPLLISFDLKPMMEFNTNGIGNFDLDLGLGIKIIL